MNLKKLFNFPFFRENIRKSRSLIAFLFGVVPLLNILYLVVTIVNLKGGVTYLTFNTLSKITLVFLYIIPIALALMLFAFLFKQKNVDFIMSKPISRKSIFTTNIIGGFLILLIFFLGNSLIYLLFNIFSPIAIPPLLILDYFIYYLVAYFLGFILSVLAISICGNLASSLIVAIIIVCLFPFLNVTKVYLNNSYTLNYLKCEDCNLVSHYTCDYTKDYDECIKMEEKGYFVKDYWLKDEYNYTPYLAFASKVEYNFKTIIKMLVLSILYLIISYYTFTRRKMENNEISFKSEILHYLVKGITLIPISFIAYLIIKDSYQIGALIFLVIVLIYSVVYDLFTRKEIYKFIKSSFITIGCFSAFVSIFLVSGKEKVKLTLDLNDVTSIKIDDTVITDKDLIKEIVEGRIENSIAFATIEMNSKNKVYNMRTDIFLSTMEKINKIAEDNYLEEVKDFNINRIEYVSDMPIDKTLKKLIKETYKSLENKVYDDTLISVYNYKNHEYNIINIPPRVNLELDKYVLNYHNREALNIINSGSELSFRVDGLPEFDSYVLEYVLNANIDKLKEYLNDNTTFNEEYSYLTISNYEKSKRIVIGDLAKFTKFLHDLEQDLETDPIYLELVKDYETMYNNDGGSNEY